MNLKQHFAFIVFCQFFVYLSSQFYNVGCTSWLSINCVSFCSTTYNSFGAYPLNNGDVPERSVHIHFLSRNQFVPVCMFLILDRFCNRLQLKLHWTGREVWLLNPNAETPYIIPKLTVFVATLFLVTLPVKHFEA
jgi:hypothetical protein